MAAAVTSRAAVLCCLFAVLFSNTVSTVSGAWPWEVGLQKNSTSTTDAPASKSPDVTTAPPSTTTPAPATTESSHRIRSRPRSHSKKHHLQTTTAPPREVELEVVETAATTEAPAPPAPPAAVQSEPQLFAPVQPQLPVVPPPDVSPIVIVEPDSYTDAGRTYRSMYGPPFGGMYPPPMPYSPPMPFYSSPPLPPPLPPYPSPYDPYSVVPYPAYQWPPIQPSYMRPYRSFPFAPLPAVSSYPSDYSPYPWWKPPVEGARVAIDSAVPLGAQGGCSSEPKRDREDFRPTLMDAPVEQKVEEPSPTHISLLPSYTPKAGSVDAPRYGNREESSVPKQKPYAEVEQPNTATANNGYGMGETAGRETHILRNNPYQPTSPAPYWPGYYEQNQWPQWNQWQQWQGPQQPQYPYIEGHPSVVPSQKRQAPGYGWVGRQYA